MGGLEQVCKGSAFPSFAKEGWTRPKENAAQHPLKGADGVVVSSYRLFIPNGFDKRWLETTTPSAPAKVRGPFFMAQPPLLREEGDYARPTSSATGPHALGYILFAPPALSKRRYAAHGARPSSSSVLGNSSCVELALKQLSFGRRFGAANSGSKAFLR